MTNEKFNPEAVQKIIQSDTVPEDNADGLTFYLDETYVNVVKPYKDEKGEESGNQIYIESEDGTGISITLTGGFIVLFKTASKPDFNPLTPKAPKSVIRFLDKIWDEIITDMREREIAWHGEDDQLTLEEFTQSFGEHQLPTDLKALFDFQAKNDRYTFSQNFYLTARDKTGIATWSSEEEFVNSFIEFACANGSGSGYAVWLIDKEINKCPIVVFGDEGGVHVVATSVKELIHLLTFDTEITVTDQDIYFFRDEDDYEASETKDAFVKWVKKKFGLDAIDTEEEVEKITAVARKEYQPKLNAFLKRFGIEI